MIRLRSIPAALLSVAVLVSTVPLDTAAASGCCLVRKSERHPWVEKKLTFEECDRENGKEAIEDDLFEPLGRVWWNVEC